MSLADRWITLFNKPIPQRHSPSGGAVRRVSFHGHVYCANANNRPGKLPYLMYSRNAFLPCTANPWHYYLHHEHLLFDCAGNSASP